MRIYRTAILYMGDVFQKYAGYVFGEELKGGISVVGVGLPEENCGGVHTVGVEATFDDGATLHRTEWRVDSIEAILNEHPDIVILPLKNEYFIQMKKLIMSLGFRDNQVFPMTIFSIYGFEMQDYLDVYNSNVSILAFDCWGAFTYKYLCMKFMSPTIAMWFKEDDYIRFAGNLEHYINTEVRYVRDGYEPNLKRDYPIARIDDVEIHFNHYRTFDEAVAKWEERKKRINMDNLFVEMCTQSRETAERFEALPHRSKVIFVPFESQLPSAIDISSTDAKLSDMSCEEYIGHVRTMSVGRRNFYKPLKLLKGRYDEI